MSLSQLAIRRPVFITMLNCVLVVFGLFSLPRLPVEEYPNVDFPVVSVTIEYPGASPRTVVERILEPLEEAVNGISGLDKVMATAYSGRGVLVLQFLLEKKSSVAADEVREKIFAALDKLPKEIEQPVIQKNDISGAPIMQVAFSSTSMDVGALSVLAKDVLRPRLQRINGIANVQTVGDRLPEWRVDIDPAKLTSYGLTSDDVVKAVQDQVVDIPSGKLDTSTHYWPIRVEKRVASPEALGAFPVSGRDNRRVRIQDIATVRSTLTSENTASFLGSDPTILMALFKQSGANTTTIANDAYATIAELKKQLPAGTKLEVVSDQSTYVRASIHSVEVDLFVGALLAIIVVLLFLRDWRATWISAIALPTAVISTFGFLYFMGFTLNMMTTLGLSLSIGILIDDAIVVIENIYRHLAAGKTAMQAAKDATDEIGLAVMATTLTICAVFVPVAFMHGIVGRFFYQFGLTVAFAVLVSLFVALTLTPMLSSRYLKAAHHQSDTKFERLFLAVEARYKTILTWCLAHRGKTLALCVVVFIFSMVQLKWVPVSFFAEEDKSRFDISLTLAENTSLQVTKAHCLKLVERIKKYPGVTRVVLSAGYAQQQLKPNAAQMNVSLVPKDQRNYSQSDIMHRIREDIGSQEKAQGNIFEISEEGRGGQGSNLQVVLQGADRAALLQTANDVAKYVKAHIPDAFDVRTSDPDPIREYVIDVYPDRAADLGMSGKSLADITHVLFDGEKVARVEELGRQLDVRVKLESKNRENVSNVESTVLLNKSGQQVMLQSVADVDLRPSPSAIERLDGQNQITVYGNYMGKDLNAAVVQIESYVTAHLPPGISMRLEGDARTMRESIDAMLLALGLAIILIYMILCAQYERYLAPVVIMMALPFSFVGAFTALLVTQQTMSIYTMIGLILLMGVVTKNGILLVDFALQRIAHGMAVTAALIEAGQMRLRPILMTTLAASFGMLPIAIGHGEGGEAKSSMGVAVIGGLLSSTLLTLVVVPCLLSVFEQLRSRRA